MKLSFAEMLNPLAVLGVCAMAGFALYDQVPGIDTTTTASIPAVRPMEGNRFIATNHLTNQSCVLALHRAPGYSVHRIEPAHNCAALGDEFVVARAWQESRTGEVVITDHRGETLMKLSRGDGFAWEVIKPVRIQASLAAF